MREEQIVIKGTRGNPKIFIGIIIAESIIAYISLLFVYYRYQNSYYYYAYISDSLPGNPYFLIYLIYDEPFAVVFLVSIVLAVFVVVTIMQQTKKREFIVTDKKVYEKNTFAKKVKIPLDQITAINAVSFNGISIATTTGVYDFYFLDNRYEIMKTLNYLLSPAEQSTGGAFPDLEQTRRDAEKLIQLKELFDDGSLTEEEYLAQKKQILKF